MNLKKFTSTRCTVSCNQQLESSPEHVFPLLCPKREYEWIEPWDCDILYSQSGYAELDCVFITDFPGEEKETWIVDRYEKNELIEFIRFDSSKVIRYRITLTAVGDNATDACWEQVITGLNEEGNQFIKKISDDDFNEKIKNLEKMLNYYLKTGKMLRLTELQPGLISNIK